MTDFNPNSIDAIVSRIESKLDTALTQMAQQGKEIEELKKWRWYIAGVFAAALVVLEFIVKR